MLDYSKAKKYFTDPNNDAVDKIYREAVKKLTCKLIVLDDDPTGVQTVHGVPVYTDWSYESIKNGFLGKEQMFFILTNSRSFTSEETVKCHIEVCETIAKISKELNIKFILLSRSDSTLRGHFPLETEIMRDTLEKELGIKFDGEVLYPFFPEGDRYTIGGTHYIKMDNELTPAALTDYAKDKTFPFSSSYLPDYIEEKTEGRYKAKDVVCVPIDDIKAADVEKISCMLSSVKDFGKICADSVSYYDAKLFCAAILKNIEKGKNYIFRISAGFVKVIGNISDKPYLKKDELIDKGNKNGGLIVIASHVKKTTEQFEELKKCEKVSFICFDQHTVLKEGAIEKEVARVIGEAEKLISDGKTVAVYTRRDRVDINTGNKEDELKIATKISDSVTSIVKNLSVRPSFLIAKGGITSSDIGTKGLGVKRAVCVGQIKPGIPVWYTGTESKFVGLPYIIFPGNVGKTKTLYEIVEELG
ncbi:MAG: hydroxyacid dehydrogenase [Ruminococcaceae bacterium]|nr:hydroxyacid dehydrogenase [Oscillospiraceae bacterium]